MFGLQVHPRCVPVASLRQGEISFHGCCIPQELKEAVGGGMVEESRARAEAGMDMLPLPDC